MNEYNYGLMISKITEAYPQDIEDSIKIKASIDFKFKNDTLPYFVKQCLWVFCVITLPFLILCAPELDRAAFYVILAISLTNRDIRNVHFGVHGNECRRTCKVFYVRMELL